MSKLAPKRMSKNHDSGAAALEYILVSTFAAVVTVAALGYVGKMIKHELGRMADKLGLEQPVDFDSTVLP